MNYDIQMPPPRDGSLRPGIDHTKLNRLVMARDLAAAEVASVLTLVHEAREQYEGAMTRVLALANENGRQMLASHALADVAELPLAVLDAGLLQPGLIREAVRERARMSELQRRSDRLHATFGPLDRLAKACVEYAARGN